MTAHAVAEPFTHSELVDFRRHQSKAWNPAYIGHRWLATIAARDVDIERERVINSGLREDLRGVQQNYAKADEEIARLREQAKDIAANCIAYQARAEQLQAAIDSLYRTLPPGDALGIVTRVRYWTPGQ